MPNPSPPLTPTHSPSKKRLLANPKPKLNPQHQNSAPIHLPQNEKKTRDLPNFSDCHGCGLRIDYSNPRQRLQLLDSFWRIVLLCKKCIKQVNSGQICLYCFKDTANSASDCVNCRECERLVHRDCVKKFGNSTPWSYSCRKLGLGLDLGFSVCIDCWVPELLRNSVRVGKKKKNENGDSGSLGKAQNGDMSVEDMVKDANCRVEKKVAVAAKAKEKALRKAVVAQNAVELASNALELAVKKDNNGKTRSEGLVRNSSGKGKSFGDVTRVVDDAELAFQLHRAMNSSPRISRNMCSVNSSCLDVLKKTGSNGISPNWMGSGSREGGKVGVCTNSKLDENQDRSFSEASAYVESKESGSAIVSGSLKPVLKTYSRNNLKRKECSENGEVGDFVTSIGVAKSVLKTYMRNHSKGKECFENAEVGDVVTSADVKPVLRTYSRNNLKRKECLENGEVGDVVTSVGVVRASTMNNDSRIVSESQFCLQDESKMELHVDSASASSPEQANGDNTYTRSNLKGKECLENGECGDFFTSVGVGISTINDDSRLASESQFCQQDESEMEFLLDNNRASSPKQSNVDIIQQEGSGIASPEQYLLKYGKRMTGSNRRLQTDASSYSESSQKENQASAPRLAYCSSEGSMLSDASLHSCDVNLQGCASVVGSSQEGG